jgi:hypothetical protein
MEYMGKRFRRCRALFQAGEERHFRIDRMLEVRPAE